MSRGGTDVFGFFFPPPFFRFTNPLEDGTGSTLDFLSSPIFQSFSAAEKHQARHKPDRLSTFLSNTPKEAAIICCCFFPHTKTEVKDKRQLNGAGEALFVDYIQIQGKKRFSSNFNYVSNFKLGHFLSKPLTLDVYSFCLSFLTREVIKIKIYGELWTSR